MPYTVKCIQNKNLEDEDVISISKYLFYILRAKAFMPSLNYCL